MSFLHFNCSTLQRYYGKVGILPWIKPLYGPIKEYIPGRKPSLYYFNFFADTALVLIGLNFPIPFNSLDVINLISLISNAKPVARINSMPKILKLYSQSVSTSKLWFTLDIFGNIGKRWCYLLKNHKSVKDHKATITKLYLPDNSYQKNIHPTFSAIYCSWSLEMLCFQ